MLKRKNKIPQNIHIHLDEIADKLWMKPSRACVLVGAGFSRNAIKLQDSTLPAPTWENLADDMIKKLYGNRGLRSSYTDILNIAEEYEAQYGKGELERFLKNKIPDNSLEPSELHKLFMSLPWSDVFTTNYDTLLERASESVVDRNYERVVCKTDLILSHSPRIIKLHGSFPSNGPYIFSAEDYRKYPVENAPFVNTVQQALLENTLCLFGFSGDDPNFKKWIGWIKDNMGDNMPKIYLIGVLNLNSSKRCLLESKNIIPIDLGPMCTNQSGSGYYDVLYDVISYLHNKKVNVDDWGSTIYSLDCKDIKKTLLLLQELLETFPGWEIVPHGKRNHIIDLLYSFPRNLLPNAKDKEAIHLIYYLNWLYERAELPIYPDDTKLIQSTMDQYYSEIEDDWKIELNLALLRAYREQGDEDRWAKIQSNIECMNVVSEYQSRYYYELCLHDISILRFADLSTHIRLWGALPNSALWKAKRASLIAEFFDLNEAKRDLEVALLSIRSSQNLVPIKNDYSSLSTESIILCILNRIMLAQTIVTSENCEHDRVRYTERMRELSMYNCDPMDELSYFTNCIHPITSESNMERTSSFDIGRISNSFHFERENKELRMALQYARVIENMAYPMHLPHVSTIEKNSANAMLYNITQLYPNMALGLMLRIGNNDIVKQIYSRKYINSITQIECDKALERLINLFADVIKPNNATCQFEAINSVIELMSRLVTKASFKTKKGVIDLIQAFYSTPMHFRINNMNALACRLMQSFTIVEQQQLVKQVFLEIQFPTNVFAVTYFECDLVYYLDDSVRLKKEDVKASYVTSLNNQLLGEENERVSAFLRLLKLYNWNLLDAEQQRTFADNLWSRVNENNFPDVLPYYYSFMASLPHPTTVEPILLLHQYINDTPFDEKSTAGVAMTHGNIELWQNILGTAQLEQYKWTRCEINNLVDAIYSWWEMHKRKLLKKDDKHMFSIKDEFKDRWNKIMQIIVEIVRSNWRLVNDIQKQKIYSIKNEVPEYTNRYLLLSIAFAKKDETNWIVKKITNAVASTDEIVVKDACDAIVYLIKDRHFVIPNCITSLTNALRYNKKPGLYYILQAIAFLVNNSITLNKNQVEDIIVGLDNLYDVLEITGADTDLEVEDKLSLQIECIKLVCQYQKNISIVPDCMQKWLQLAKDPNAFSEMRNALMNEF